MEVQITLNSMEEAQEIFAYLASKQRGATAAVPTIPAPSTPISTQAPLGQPTALPTQAPGYTLDQLSRAATTLLDAGRQGELYGLLHSFGVPALTVLPKERYGEFATALRQLGAKL